MDNRTLIKFEYEFLTVGNLLRDIFTKKDTNISNILLIKCKTGQIFNV